MSLNKNNTNQNPYRSVKQKQLLSLLDSKNYRTFHVEIAKKLGSINAAVLLSDLIDCHQFHESKGELTSHEKHGNNWFFYTVEKCEDRTTLTERQQSSALSSLKNFNLIESANFGVPCKRHFRINIDSVIDFLNEEGGGTSSDKMSELEDSAEPVPTKRRNCVLQNVGTIYEPNKEPKNIIIADPPPDPKKCESSSMPAGGNNNFFTYLKEKKVFTDSECKALLKFPEDVVQSALKYVFHPTTNLEGEKAQFKMVLHFCRNPSNFDDKMKSLDNPPENKKMIVGDFIPGKKYNGIVDGLEFIQDKNGYGFLHPNGLSTYFVSFKEAGYKQKFLEICNNLRISYA